MCVCGRVCVYVCVCVVAVVVVGGASRLREAFSLASIGDIGTVIRRRKLSCGGERRCMGTRNAVVECFLPSLCQRQNCSVSTIPG
jgi:hypothetical protein